MSRKRHKKGKKPVTLSAEQRRQPDPRNLTYEELDAAQGVELVDSEMAGPHVAIRTVRKVPTASPPPLGVSVAEDVGTNDRLG